MRGWIRSLLAVGVEPEIFLIEQTDNWREAERFWIAYLRWLGCDLTNISAGGEGVPMDANIAAKIAATRRERGLKPSPEAMGRSIAIRALLWQDPEWREERVAHRRRTQRNLWDDPSHQRKMRASRQRRWSPELSQAMQRGMVAARENNGGADPRATLTITQVQEIRSLRSSGLTYAQIMHATGQNRGVIVSICLRKTWKHLP